MLALGASESARRSADEGANQQRESGKERATRSRLARGFRIVAQLGGICRYLLGDVVDPFGRIRLAEIGGVGDKLRQIGLFAVRNLSVAHLAQKDPAALGAHVRRYRDRRRNWLRSCRLLRPEQFVGVWQDRIEGLA